MLKRSPRLHRAACATLVALALATAVPFAQPAFNGPFSVTTALQAPPRQEASGLAISRRTDDLFWMHDDSKGTPVLYAVDRSGTRRGALRISGTRNEDWEDLASFERDGKAWLLIADTGDNDAKRGTVNLHVVEEPPAAQLNPARDTELAPAYTIRLCYENGPRDCESVAVDAREGMVYLLTKRDDPSQLHRVPLARPTEKTVTARRVGSVTELAGNSPIESLFKHVAGKRAAWPTAMDISADGRAAVVLTYAMPVVFVRQGNEAWADTFKREPVRLLFHGLPQAEGVCFSRDGASIYVASESTATLVRYDREAR
jgi:hypothetical protein